MLQGPVLAGLWTDRTPCIYCYRVQYSPVDGQTELHVFTVTGSSIIQYWPDDGQTELHIFTVTGSSIGRMMDRQNSEVKTGYQGKNVYPVGVVYTGGGYRPGLSGHYPKSVEDGHLEASSKFCSTLLNMTGAAQSCFLAQACSR